MILRVCLENFPVGSIWRSPQFYRRPHAPATMPHFVTHCVVKMTHGDAKNDAKGPAESNGERGEAGVGRGIVRLVRELLRQAPFYAIHATASRKRQTWTIAYFLVKTSKSHLPGRSSAWLERMVWEYEPFCVKMP